MWQDILDLCLLMQMDIRRVLEPSLWQCAPRTDLGAGIMLGVDRVIVH